jgi:hypothetical protein
LHFHSGDRSIDQFKGRQKRSRRQQVTLDVRQQAIGVNNLHKQLKQAMYS